MRVHAGGGQRLDQRRRLIVRDDQRRVGAGVLDRRRDRRVVRLGWVEGVLLAVHHVDAGILELLQNDVAHAGAVLVVEAGDGELLHAVLRDEVAHHRALHGIRGDGAEEVRVHAGERHRRRCH